MPSKTVYDNTLRDEPVRGSTLDMETGKTTHWYDDGYRHSQDDNGSHWTDQTKEKGDPDRHNSPEDSRR